MFYVKFSSPMGRRNRKRNDPYYYAPVKPKNEKISSVLAYVDDHPNCIAEDLAASLGMHSVTALRYLRYLLDQGCVTRKKVNRTYHWKAVD